MIGIFSGGIIGSILLFIYINVINLENNFSHIFIIINIISLIIIFCCGYKIFSNLIKNSLRLRNIHGIILNILIGSIFGLIVGYFSNSDEIFWFILFFSILSIIPIVNYIMVVSILGLTIFTFCFPDFSISIINVFLPIRITDTSFIWIMDLPLFVIPIFAFLGFLMMILLFQKNLKLGFFPIRFTDHKELQNEMNNYGLKLKKWVSEGYDIRSLEEKLRNGNLLNNIEKFKDYESRILKLKVFEQYFNDFDIKGFDYDIISIKKKLKKPDELDDLKIEISTLKKRISIKIENSINEMSKEIKLAIISASSLKDSERLSVLKILQLDVLNLYNSQFSENSFKSTLNRIDDIYQQLQTLKVSYDKKYEKSISNEFDKSNYYQILNVKPDATQEQIKKMFRRLSLAYHPDTEEETGVNGDNRYRMIIQAYEILKDSIKRKKYDKEIGLKK